MEEFQQAMRYGSKNASLNIEKVESLIRTQKSEDIDIPGIFAVIVGSAKYEQMIEDQIEKISQILTIQKEDLQVYEAETGRYFFAMGSDLSYAKAQSMKSSIEDKVSDAFVSSTTRWKAYSFPK